MKKIEITGTTDDSGDLEVDTTDGVYAEINGYIEKVVMVYDDGATGADLTLTCEDEISETILVQANLGVADRIWYPRTSTNKVADGVEDTSVYTNKIMVFGDLKLVIANGGDTKNFKFEVYIDDGESAGLARRR